METKSRFSNRYATLITLLLIAVAVWPASALAAGQVFRWSINEDPTSLDPPAAYGNTAIQICQNLFDGLTALTNDMKVVPSIAKSWDISDDGLVYTFHLRQDAIGTTLNR